MVKLIILLLNKIMLHISRRFYSFGRVIISRNKRKKINEKKNEKIIEKFFEKYDNDKKIREALKYGNEELEKYKKNDTSRHWGLNPRPPHYKCDALPLS